jgi:hypothetical protein
VDLDLIAVLLNGVTPDYDIMQEGLLLKNVPEHFILEIKTF